MTKRMNKSNTLIEDNDGTHRAPVGRRRTVRAIQITLGFMWLLDGLMQLQPRMFGMDFTNGVILPAAHGQPAFVAGAITHVAHLISLQPALIDLAFAIVQILIGVGLLVRRTVRPALVVSFGWAFGVWAFGEGFGMLFTGTASPLTGAPGAALLYAAIGLLVWPRREGLETARSAAATAAEGSPGASGGTALWAVVWCGMGILWLLPANRSGGSASAAIRGAVTGEPSWLAGVQLGVAHALGGAGASLAVLCGIVSFTIGLGPLVFRRSTSFLAAGAIVALAYWVFGEAFGQIFSGLATDPNSGPLLVLLALAVYAIGAPEESRAAGPAPSGNTVSARPIAASL